MYPCKSVFIRGRFGLRILLLILLCLQLPQVLAQGLVLLLCFEGRQVRRVIGFQSCIDSGADSREFRTLCQFCFRGFRATFVATFHSVLRVAFLRERDVRVATQFAGQGLHQVHRFNFCHFVSAIELIVRRQTAISFSNDNDDNLRGNQLSAALEGGGSI